MNKSRLFFLPVAVALLALAMLFGWQASVLAQPPMDAPSVPLSAPAPISTYQRMQNLDSVTSAMTLTVYNTSGGVQGSASANVNPNFSALFDQRTCCNVNTGFQGSGVVNSTGNVAGVTFMVSSGGAFRSDAYTAVPGPSAYSGTQLIPQAFRGVPYRGQTFTTTIGIQNAGSTAGDIYVTYFPYNVAGYNCGILSPQKIIRPAIAANASTYVNFASTGNSLLDSCTAQNLYGSVSVTGTQPVALVVSQSMDAGLAAHTGLIPSGGPAPVDGGTKLIVPQAFKHYTYNGLAYSSSFQVMTQNLVTAQFTVTLHTRCASQGVCAGGPDIVFTRTASPAFPVDLFFIPELSSYTAWYGSAEITSNVPLVGLVNSQSDPNNSSILYGYSTAKLFPSTAGSTKLAVPHIIKNEAYPASDGITWAQGGINIVANMPGTFSGNVYCTYYVDNNGLSYTRVQAISNTNPNASCDAGQDPVLSGLASLHGSAIVTTTNNINIIGTVTQTGPGTTDSFMTYSAVNQ